MQARLKTRWLALHQSLWFIPALLTATSAALAVGLIEVDSRLHANGRLADLYFGFGGGAEGARGVLDAISGTMITVTGVVFSLTIIALQLASSQFTPRVLRTFTSDRANQVVLGFFIGTFTYSLLVQRTVRSGTEGGPAFVPSVAVSGAIALALVSIGFLIFYINHTALSIQAAVIVDRVTRDTTHLVQELFPEPMGSPAPSAGLVLPAAAPATISAEMAGYLQAVDSDTLFDLSQEGNLTVRMEPYIGDFLLTGAPLASVWPANAVDDHVIRRIRQAFVTGPERTLQEDMELGIRQLADIAVRALSPGINDPTTATMCIDRLAEVLVNLGTRRPPDKLRRDETGRVCFVARVTTFDRAVSLSFEQIRHYGSGDATVVAHLLGTLGRIGALVHYELHAALVGQIGATLDEATATITAPLDVARARAAGEHALALLATPVGGDSAMYASIPTSPTRQIPVQLSNTTICGGTGIGADHNDGGEREPGERT